MDFITNFLNDNTKAGSISVELKDKILNLYDEYKLPFLTFKNPKSTTETYADCPFPRHTATAFHKHRQAKSMFCPHNDYLIRVSSLSLRVAITPLSRREKIVIAITLDDVLMRSPKIKS